MYFLYTLLLVTVLGKSYDCDKEPNNVLDSNMESSFSNRSDTDALIVNGWQAKDGEFPYQVGISRRIEHGHIFICGGSLISEIFVVSAGQCFAMYLYPNRYMVYLGDIKRERGTNRVGLEIIIHPGYREEPLRNDIALLRINPVSYRIIPLAGDCGYTFEGDIVYAAGWGTYGDLQYTQMTVVSNEKCFRLQPMTSNNICAVSSKSGTCYGDTGGPLVHGETNILIGIISLAEKNGRDCNVASGTVFTRVDKYREWIRKYTGV